VSSGAEKVTVPQVVGLDENNARSQLDGAGLKVKVSEQDVVDPGQDGQVISQSPAAGQQVDRDSEVTIVVARAIDLPGGGGGGGD
jgi:beta-lactam-binding protein with PASTA domain